MAQIIKLRRSAVAGNVPTTSQLGLGELAINTADGKIYFEKNDGSATIQTIVTTNSQTTGSLEVTGNISGSATSTGSFGKAEIAGNINVGGFTTLGNGISSNGGNFQISTSGTEPVLDLKKSGQIRARLAVDSNTYVSTGNDNTSFGVGTSSSNNAKLSIYTPTTAVHKYAINAADQSANKFTVDIAGNVTASGHISSSATSTGSFGRVEAEHFHSTDDMTVADDLTVDGLIVASGNEIRGS